MKNSHTFIYPAIFIFMMQACQKTDTEILTGDIRGVVKLYDDNSKPVKDLSGVQVKVAGEGQSWTTVTTCSGDFTFNQIPVGKYIATLEKKGYMDDNQHSNSHLPRNEFYHEGGPASTRLNYNMYAIPGFAYRLDSGWVKNSYCNLFGEGPDISVFSPGEFYYYKVICFFNDTINVSKDKYFSYTFGVYMDLGDYNGPRVMTDYISNFYSYDSDSVYVRIYPVALGENSYDPFRPGSAGPPSNVIRIPVIK